MQPSQNIQITHSHRRSVMMQALLMALVVAVLAFVLQQKAVVTQPAKGFIGQLTQLTLSNLSDQLKLPKRKEPLASSPPAEWPFIASVVDCLLSAAFTAYSYDISLSLQPAARLSSGYVFVIPPLRAPPVA
ncbi:hypothetical protein ACKC9G_03515 [Pokkaliibacter sp. CJK22405]|uniref:hypothetical protein n=1 Tax=Pokkaliibacter sp. CJK22405 TaxID=3384615 RepID=UPI00398500F8